MVVVVVVIVAAVVVVVAVVGVVRVVGRPFGPESGQCAYVVAMIIRLMKTLCSN